MYLGAMRSHTGCASRWERSRHSMSEEYSWLIGYYPEIEIFREESVILHILQLYLEDSSLPQKVLRKTLWWKRRRLNIGTFDDSHIC